MRPSNSYDDPFLTGFLAVLGILAIIFALGGLWLAKIEMDLRTGAPLQNPPERVETEASR